jgi:hypothetical protein
LFVWINDLYLSPDQDNSIKNLITEGRSTIEMKNGGFINIDDNCNYFMDTNK